MSKTKQDIQDELSVAVENEHIWTSFLEHPGWKKLEKVLQEQVELRKQAVCLTPINSVGQAFSQEFFKGECQGISTALETPHAQLELAQMERRIANNQLEAEDEPEDEVAAAIAGRLDGSPFGG